MNRICVFTGSSPGARPEYAAAARELGRALAARGFELVYGGANVGLMGVLADSTLDAGGRVIGVIPEGLVAHEVAHRGLSELRIVSSMHERKTVMSELADGIIALPGGLGTLEELFEMLTWAQLGLHGKPCGLLEVRGYFDKLLSFLDDAVTERFISREHRELLLSEQDASLLLDRMERHTPRETEKRLDRDAR
jgi:uncharacterized protein (TIGR00730 family)